MAKPNNTETVYYPKVQYLIDGKIVDCSHGMGNIYCEKCAGTEEQEEEAKLARKQIDDRSK